MQDPPRIIEVDIPARLDRLPWGRFHRLIVAALGITWILDGLEVTLAGSVAGALKESPTLHLDESGIGLASSAYLAGAVLGALVFGWLTDRMGRRRFFFITLIVYTAATTASGLAWNAWSFALLRFLTGMGIGGEYTAINSTIQEFVPARYRGWTDIGVNGTFWVGAALGAGGSILLLDPAFFGPDTGWRICFLIGGALCLPIFLMRLWLPESPRWLMRHGRVEQADAIVRAIESEFRLRGYVVPSAPAARIRLLQRGHLTLREVADALIRRHSRRVFLHSDLLHLCARLDRLL